MPSLRCCFFQRICYNGRISAAIMFLSPFFSPAEGGQPKKTAQDTAPLCAAVSMPHKCGHYVLIAVFLARQRRATEKDGAGYRAALRCGIHAA